MGCWWVFWVNAFGNGWVIGGVTGEVGRWGVAVFRRKEAIEKTLAP
ncbi:hypothetical protein L8106_06394 [Lyngbya sp. PCC 8106]|nr:hypothetical protein L8106_06394 [Lyngbya sp. PCC 8106]